jgi:hypothetical protein
MRAKVIVAQFVILAGVAVWLKVYIPRMEAARAATAVLEREKRIQTSYQSMVVEDTNREVEAPESKAKGPVHPLRLRTSASVGEVEQTLGAPDSEQSDFRGGLHLMWAGSQHTLEASFNRGRLYCLTITDRQTGHGSMVFESSLYWRPF